MLSQTRYLSNQVDGRYAEDAELQFIREYSQSFDLRLETYKALQAAETKIIQEVYERMCALRPNVFKLGNADFSNKWKRDTIRVFRYSAAALLINDPETLQERFLSWFQTIMRSFEAQRVCDVTYELMQRVVQQHLPSHQASLFCPLLVLNRRYLGTGT